MVDKIDIHRPDWVEIPPNCPNCSNEFKEKIGSPPTGPGYSYTDSDSKHGEYTQIECSRCGIVVQRHYESDDVGFIDDPLVSPNSWVYRAQVLENETVLKRREAQVKALKEELNSHSEVAETLGISKSTVGEYVRRVENRVEESIRTLEEVSNEIHPLRHMEGQLNGWPVFIGDEYPCGGCGSIIEAGSEAVAVLEFVGQNWQTHEMYCKECDRDDYHIAAPVGHSMSIDEFFDEFQEAGSLVALVEADIGSLDARFASLRTPYKAGSLTLEDPYVRDVFN